MEWNEQFERLTAAQQLGVAAAFAERVLPLAGGISALDDGLALVWLQVGGRDTTKLELTRVLNAAIGSAKIGEDRNARAYAARSMFCVMEAALHRPYAAAEAIECALAAARAVSEVAGTEEETWIAWAVEVAGSDPAPGRATFVTADAPKSSWRGSMSSENLPLFGGNR